MCANKVHNVYSACMPYCQITPPHSYVIAIQGHVLVWGWQLRLPYFRTGEAGHNKACKFEMLSWQLLSYEENAI